MLAGELNTFQLEDAYKEVANQAQSLVRTKVTPQTGLIPVKCIHCIIV